MRVSAERKGVMKYNKTGSMKFVDDVFSLIDKFSAKECKQYVLLVTRDDFAKSDGDFDDTILGVTAMHAKIRFFGLNYVNQNKAPTNWAYQLVGILACGFSEVTRSKVEDAILVEGWA